MTSNIPLIWPIREPVTLCMCLWIVAVCIMDLFYGKCISSVTHIATASSIQYHSFNIIIHKCRLTELIYSFHSFHIFRALFSLLFNIHIIIVIYLLFSLMWCDVHSDSSFIENGIYCKRVSPNRTSLRGCSLAPFIRVCFDVYRTHRNIYYDQIAMYVYLVQCTLNSKMNSTKTGSLLILKSMKFVWFTSCWLHQCNPKTMYCMVFIVSMYCAWMTRNEHPWQMDVIMPEIMEQNEWMLSLKTK